MNYLISSNQSLHQGMANAASSFAAAVSFNPALHNVIAIPAAVPQTNYLGAASVASEKQNDIPKIKLGSHEVVKTIRDVWAEWKEPWDGHPSVEELIQNYGDKWRDKSDSERKLFSRRKAVVTAIEKGLETKTLENVIEDLELERDGRSIATWIDARKKRQRNQ